MRYVQLLIGGPFDGEIRNLETDEFELFHYRGVINSEDIPADEGRLIDLAEQPWAIYEYERTEQRPGVAERIYRHLRSCPYGEMSAHAKANRPKRHS